MTSGRLRSGLVGFSAEALNTDESNILFPPFSLSVITSYLFHHHRITNVAPR